MAASILSQILLCRVEYFGDPVHDSFHSDRFPSALKITGSRLHLTTETMRTLYESRSKYAREACWVDVPKRECNRLNWYVCFAEEFPRAGHANLFKDFPKRQFLIAKEQLQMQIARAHSE